MTVVDTWSCLVNFIYIPCIFLCFLALQVQAADRDISGSKDHRLITRYPNSVIVDYEYRDYDACSLPTGAIDGYRDRYHMKGSLELEGELTRITYSVKDKTSTLKVFSNFEKALISTGFETIFSCAGSECGMQGTWGYALEQMKLLNGKQQTIRYYIGKKTAGDGNAFVAVYVMEKRSNKVLVGLNVLETKKMQKDLVAVDISNLQLQLEENGKVAMYGIHFDVDKANLKADSAETLDAIRKLLEENADLKLYVVGHTDDTGSLQHNLELSRRRAKAVVTELVNKYGIATDRVSSFGAGPYAPVATNGSEAGKAKNRRVELVRRSD